ncbi:riboflavin synthase [Enterobacteriaceae endosymbiont of Donacia bicoloricornis]|uniref:riboflavin synthase n=1 Tax=Enterobacteriaceae endosymbiont of Donacia bicoloricornis TaxID=2675772 RepID=UPI0014491450|nr:riboflavin synthase [Enterobacteriaceae endosymbiont of Donacia bicoloricornis]QJC37644.1 riboflavin synthase [Enterobacteriaceae endosymbiont of Donacia bicoloricornis]
MFTGIVQSIGKIQNIILNKNLYFLYIKTNKKFIKNLKIGESISNNGCCLTIIKLYNNIITFNIIKHTFNITTFKKIKIGDYVNLEKPIKINNYIGGHIVLGHITDTAIITNIKNYNSSKILWIKPNNILQMNYILEKGSICVDGVSLTIDRILKNKFSVNIIPETLSKTTLSKKNICNYVNIETDIYIRSIIQTVKKLYNNTKYLT